MSRPPKELTQKELEMIAHLTACGSTQEDIARILGVSVETMKKYGREHYLRGKAVAKARAGMTCFQMATSGKHGDMTKFYLRSQAGWHYKQPIPEELEKYLGSLEGVDNEDDA